MKKLYNTPKTDLIRLHTNDALLHIGDPSGGGVIMPPDPGAAPSRSGAMRNTLIKA